MARFACGVLHAHERTSCIESGGTALEDHLRIHVLRYTAGGSVNQPLADLITSHTFSQPDANTIGITLTAQTRNVAPNTEQKHQYTLTETVLRRN